MGRPHEERLVEIVFDFLNAETWVEGKKVVETNQKLLLSEAADQVFADLLEQYKGDAVTTQRILRCWEYIARCRSEGVDAAFAAFAQLHSLVEELKSLTRPVDIPRRVEVCRAAIKLIDESIQTELAARLHYDLGNSLANNPLDDRASNLEQAIHHYTQALKVYTSDAFPEDWAMTQNTLGNAYTNRIKGTRADNLELAIHHFTQALEVRTREALPKQWAATQNNLGNAYTNRIRGERAGNIEQAIHHFTQALEVRTREALPKQWAATQNNLGNAYYYRIHGKRADNLELAIYHYNQALEVRTHASFPADWAMTLNNLGVAYWVRICGERAENLEEAIHHFNQALKVYTCDAFPEQWAMTQNNLGNAYTNRIRGERAGNIEQAIHHFTQALEVRTREALPKQWAATQNNLGNAYYYRIQGKRADNLEQAIHHYNQALKVYTSDAFPEDWAMTQNNLGIAYNGRIKGTRADNLELAIQHYTQALQVYTSDAFPEKWALTQNNLAKAYSVRIHGERADNIEEAIHHYRQAEVYLRWVFPEKWALTQNNLANVYSVRIRGERADNLEQAIQYSIQALLVYSRVDYPEGWATAQSNLGNAYSNRIHGERADNLEQAINHYNQALEVRTRAAFPEQWATTQNNLGLAYADRIREERTGNLNEAITCYSKALEVRTLEQHPADRLQTMFNLGNLYFNERDWAQALNTYNGAIEAGDALLASAYTEVGRRSEVGETSWLYARAAYSLLQMDQPDEALLTLEQGKTRLLAEALALADADLATLPDAQKEAMREARNRVRNLEAKIRELASQQYLTRDSMALALTDADLALLPESQSQANREASRVYEFEAEMRELAELMSQTRTDLNQLIETILRDQPDFISTGLDLPGILSLIPRGGALIAPLVTSQGSAAFVLPHGVESVEPGHVVRLDDLTDEGLLKLLQGPAEEPEWGGWMGAYFTFRDTSTGEAFERWRAAIETATGHLWDALMGHIHEKLTELRLSEDAMLILMPQGGLGLLPLHAAWSCVDGEKRFFVDDYTVSYAPSAYALSVGRDRLKDERRRGASLLALVNPTEDLRYADVEGEAVAALFSPDAQSRLNHGAATREAVVEAATGRTYLHFSCHGFYDWREAMSSGLLLADSTSPKPEPFTLSEIISSLDLGATRLVTLSACETGITEFRQSPDEYIGLPAGFLQAGAPCVVSTLWAVDDLSTALLMECFYHKHLDEGLSPSRALRAAQRWLRREADRPIVMKIVEDKLAELEKRRREVRAIARFSEEEATIDRQEVQLRDQLRFLAREERRDPWGRPFDHPYYWAPFTVSGADGAEEA